MRQGLTDVRGGKEELDLGGAEVDGAAVVCPIVQERILDDFKSNMTEMNVTAANAAGTAKRK